MGRHRRTERGKTVRREVMGTRREGGVVVAYILSCGHEFSIIGKGKLVYTEDRKCNECTEAEEKLWHGRRR